MLRNLCLHKVSQEQKTLKVATPRFYSQVPDLFHPTRKQTELSYFNAKPRTDGWSEFFSQTLPLPN